MKLINSIISNGLLNCYQATKYISELIDNEQVNIGFKYKTKLYFHLLMCESCKNYKIQLTELHKAFQTHDISHYLPNLQLSKESEDRIQKLILEKLNEM